MPDPRVLKLAQLMVNYSLALKPSEQFVLRTHPLANELTLAVYKESIKAGAYVLIQNEVPGTEEIFYKYASNEQLDYQSSVKKMITGTYDAFLTIWSEHNTRHLSGVDPNRISRASKAGAELTKLFLNRSAKKEMRWCLTVYPTEAMAQEADMSLADYEDFVYGAGMLNEDDPVSSWKQMGVDQLKIVEWLRGKNKVALKGSNIDLTMSIQDRSFIPCDGKANFPDGEIFTGPVENSVNGWVRFRYPAIEHGQEITDIELWFENGRVVKESASKNQDLLTSQLNTDPGARYLGEFGIGTNYGIQRFTKNMLFDEKMGGTIHLAVGAGYPETGSKNSSGIHWDMLCDMADAEIKADGDLFYKHGKSII